MPTSAERNAMIADLRALPGQLEALVSGLSEAQLTTHYLPDEWTVAQNIHHLADSHMVSFTRMKLILTEDNPTLKSYSQDGWAALPDATHTRLSESITLLRALHTRWATLFESLTEEQWARTGVRDDGRVSSLDDVLRIYSNHGKSHMDQIRKTLAAAPK
ncbi:MAG: DinB family protein [Anaerolineae bacterium]|nr:DinB family protein [Anaerolineae bacterium]